MTTTNSPSMNWARNLEYSATTLHEPTSIDELCDIVAGAPSLRALGSRHSFNTIADTRAAQVSVARIPVDLQIDASAGTVTVGAGARYGEFVEELDRAGWAIHNLASLPHISVGGAIATGTHGSGDGNGSLASAVAALEIVTADGTLVTLRRGDADFAGAVVSLGALGIVTRVTLDIGPSFQVRQDVFEMLPWHTLAANYDTITSSAYSVSLFTHWGDEGITQAWLKSRMDAAGPAAHSAPDFFGAVPATVARHPLPDVAADHTTLQLGEVGPWWDRLAHFQLGFTPSNGLELQSEYLVPRRNVLGAIEAIRALGPRIQPLLLVGELRTIAGDGLWLSPSHDEDCVGFHFTWKQHIPEVEALLPAIDDAFAPFGGRPHWGKVFDTDAARLNAAYPRLGEFRELAERMDPAGKFRNDFVNRWVFGS